MTENNENDIVASCENYEYPDKDRREQVKPMYEAYHKWYLDNEGVLSLGQIRFGQIMSKKFKKRR